MITTRFGYKLWKWYMVFTFSPKITIISHKTIVSIFFVNNGFPPKSANVVGNHHFHQVHKLGKWKWVD